MSAAYNIAAPQARPESIISDVSDDGPDTAQQKSSRDYVPSLSSDHSYGYQRRAVSPTDEYSRDANQKYVSPSQASENGDTSLSEVAEAYRNHAMISGGPDRGGRRTPRAYERGEVTSDVIEGLQDEIERLRILLDQEQSKREELKSQFSRWKDAIAHNTKAYIKNSQVNLHKNHMRIYPLLNDEGDYPDMVVFPTTVGAMMKMNEAHLTRLVVFYGLQSDPGMDYYAKYCALRDHLGIEP
ncbi:hypothetical protein TWF225_011877 [Orbilia oligospora]|uniref:Uncharacterized protein n=1 Tax=Orbilia oligospora TaxID=2813651 RepID=A0A7C8P344_ORBOL|nr:hypothetical protein TWF751_011809 [Orbilia oligospora]KAF3167960.1 hypothetical protein TWF225_011877 [Orbilia oligospora]KAF3234034.1 hypothetical protein TWF128_002643 [Orbilia oligospora]KAF3254984.1 hypothetical protein TWF217_006687 [Orbilia oligospora]KAF3280727.1 hypothetical protein TWF132_011475 [Orbilia oligospora]